MFNPESGQVFREWTISGPLARTESNRLDWSRKRLYPTFKTPGSNGPRGLVDMAINVIADNIGDVAESHLESIPTPILWRLWRFLEVRGVCLHAWKILSKFLLPDDGDGSTLALYRFRQHICQPTGEIQSYIWPLSSPTVDFITHLVISGGSSFSTHEMLCLADMKNLAVLELVQPIDERSGTFPQISDRLIRGWTEKEDPFPLLRILKIWGDQPTTRDSLQWVSKFPSLALYDVLGAREDWKGTISIAQEHGWEVADARDSLEESLLRSLMLFAPVEASHINSLQSLSSSIDSDLNSICSDARSAVKFVPDGEAPPLLEYLTDKAKAKAYLSSVEAMPQETRTCHVIPFESWGFWLYSFIGQLGHDHDLKSKGFASGKQAVAGPFVLPSKPIACLHLGHNLRGGISSSAAYVSRGLFRTRRYTFTRRDAVGMNAKKPEPVVIEPKTAEQWRTQRKQKRRRHIDDMLHTFGI